MGVPSRGTRQSQDKKKQTHWLYGAIRQKLELQTNLGLNKRRMYIGSYSLEFSRQGSPQFMCSFDFLFFFVFFSFSF